MKNLPTPVKWLIVALAFAAVFGLLKYVDYRATQVDMPAPESWLIANRSSSSAN